MPSASQRSGVRILTIAEGPITVELLPEIGARLHRLRVFGQDLLRTPDDPTLHLRDPFGWGAYVMAPWCNRIATTPTRIDGNLVALVPNFADGSAIHGRVYATPWQELEDGTLHVHDGGDGWPWEYKATLRIAIAGMVLVIEQSLTNLAATPMPAGLGLHPWFNRPIEVRIDAAQVLPSNVDPAATAEPVSGSLDLREMGPMPDDLDAAWLGIGDPAVELRWPTLGVAASLRGRSDTGLCIVAASPRGVDAIAIEPQTHAPHGLRRFLDGEPAGLVPLAPGATVRLTTELAFGRPGT
jgi:aldose 1-epimerase